MKARLGQVPSGRVLLHAVRPAIDLLSCLISIDIHFQVFSSGELMSVSSGSSIFKCFDTNETQMFVNNYAY